MRREDLLWQGKPVDDHLVIVFQQKLYDDLDRDLTMVELSDPEEESRKIDGVAFVWDTDEQRIIAAAFDRTQFSKSQAEAWLKEETKRFSTVSVKGSTLTFFRRMMDNLKKLVPEEVFTEAFLEARAHAGGKARHEEQEQAEPTPEQEEVVPEPKAMSLVRALAVASTPSAKGERTPYLDEETGYVWKVISRAGLVYQPFTGEPARITPQILKDVVASFGKTYQYVDIPIGHEWDSPDRNTGFIRELRLSDDGMDLWAAMDFTEPEIRDKVLRGTIADVSIWIDPDIIDQNDGTTIYPWALAHACLTNKPLMTDLGAFSATKTISYGGKQALAFSNHRVEDAMADEKKEEQQEETQAPAVFAAGSTVGLTTPHDFGAVGEAYTIADVRQNVTAYTLQAGNGDVIKWFLDDEVAAAVAGEHMDEGNHSVANAQLTDEQLERALKARGYSLEKVKEHDKQFAVLTERARKNRTKEIRDALEGRIDAEGVNRIDGYRHAPAVVEIAMKLLDERPKAMKMSVSVDGTCQVDDLVLELLNAIPQEQRIKEKVSFSIPRHENKPKEETAEDRAERLKEFSKRLNGAR